jgi:hypothetical protein
VKCGLPKLEKVQRQVNRHMVVKELQSGEFREFVADGHFSHGRRSEYHNKGH